MAATRRNALLIAEARQKIQTTQLINRLQNHGLGTLEMTATQIKAIEILLRKAVPDLATVTMQGDDDGGPVQMTLEQQAEEARASIREAFAEVAKEREHGEAKGSES
jgi:hypothetical protein